MRLAATKRFTESRNTSSESHPILAGGNFVEGLIGCFAIGSAIYSIIVYGWSAALIFSLLYTIAVTIIALTSAYHLA